MGYDFTQKQCIKAFIKIGFTDASKRGAKHFKYKPPERCKLDYGNNIKPFITVPKHKFFCQDAIVKEINRLCGEQAERDFLNNL